MEISSPLSKIDSRLREWNLWLEMINTLIINIRRFDWISSVSREVLTSLESALRHLEVLKFLWQKKSRSVKWKRTRWHKLVSSALQMHFTVHLKSPMWTHLRVKVHRILFTTCLQDYELLVLWLAYRHGRSGYRQSGRWRIFAHP